MYINMKQIPSLCLLALALIWVVAARPTYYMAKSLYYNDLSKLLSIALAPKSIIDLNNNTVNMALGTQRGVLILTNSDN